MRRCVSHAVAPQKAVFAVDADMVLVPEYRHRDLNLSLVAGAGQGLALAPGDYQEFRARRGDLTAQAMAMVKRSPKRTANWALAMDHSRGGMIHCFSERFKTRNRSSVAASSLGKWPLARTARRSLAFKASMALVVYKIRRTSPGKA
jgi:hypothetical protein